MGRHAGGTADETREKLVDAAASVFADRGYERATVAEIARAAGLSSGAIYAHYRSKAELLVDTVRARGAAEIGNLLADEVPSDLGAMIVALGRRLESHAAASRLLLVEAMVAARRDDELAAVVGELLVERQRSMAAVLRGGQEAGLVDPGVSADVVARFVLMAGLGARLFLSLGLPALDEDEWSPFVERLVATFRTEPPAADPPSRSRGRRPATGTKAGAGRAGSRRTS
jgi:AcrR family transcriptional regulator